MTNATATNGVSMSFLELFEKYKDGIVIPIAQRDYAHGRSETQAEQVREGILTSLRNAICQDEKDKTDETVFLDYIYGSVPQDGEKFLPIDGQQRLTTLLLLHIYLAVKDDKFKELSDIIGDKFSYEVRDTTEEFVHALCKNGYTQNENKKPSEEIKNTPWYHLTYNDDPSVVAMLKMLDVIDEFFKNVSGYKDVSGKVVSGYEALKNGRVKFWTLKLENFGLTDDLFIKMNSRGKKLSPYDNFKSAFEESLNSKVNEIDPKLVDDWKNKIDNDWLDFFWKHFHNKGTDKTTPEQALFRHILFFSRILGKNNRAAPYLEYRDLNDTNYSDDIDTLSEKENLEFLIYTLDNIKNLVGNKTDELFDLWEKAVNSSSAGDFIYKKRVLLYAKFYFLYSLSKANKCSEPDDMRIKNFWHVYDHLLNGQRETNTRDKQYNSSIDAEQIGTFISSTNRLIDAVAKRNIDIYAVLTDTNSNLQGGFSYYGYEEAKAKYIYKSPEGINDTYKGEIWGLEKIPCLDGLIHNFLDVLDDGSVKPVISSDRVEKIYDFLNAGGGGISPERSVLLLRTIQSCSKEWIAEKSFHGNWKLVRRQGEDEAESWHKYYCGFSTSPAECGEYLMTMLPGRDETHKHITEAVKKFWREIEALCPPKLSTSDKIEVSLKEIIRKNLTVVQANGLAYYFAKYPEFWGKEGSDCFVGLIPKTNGFYSQIRVFDTREEGKNARIDVYKHYNPFYSALENALLKTYPSLKVQHSTSYDAKRYELDFTFHLPCIGLSFILNGPPGNFNWDVDVKNVKSKIDGAIIPDGRLVLECGAGDCIEKMLKWLRDYIIYNEDKVMPL
jgi:uncharacterized protein with ParB-like and HNH nuclease domain